MSLAVKKEQEQYSGKAPVNPFAGRKDFTYKDYLKWPDDVRAEIIYGVASTNEILPIIPVTVLPGLEIDVKDIF